MYSFKIWFRSCVKLFYVIYKRKVNKNLMYNFI